MALVQIWAAMELLFAVERVRCVSLLTAMSYCPHSTALSISTTHTRFDATRLAHANWCQPHTITTEKPACNQTAHVYTQTAHNQARPTSKLLYICAHSTYIYIDIHIQFHIRANSTYVLLCCAIHAWHCIMARDTVCNNLGCLMGYYMLLWFPVSYPSQLAIEVRTGPKLTSKQQMCTYNTYL